MSIRLASLFIELGADSANLRTEFARSSRTARNWERELQQIGQRASTAFNATGIAVAGIGASFTAIFKTTAPLIDGLGKTADRLGATTEGLQAVRFAGEKAGLAFGTIDTALQRQTRRLAEAAQGLGEARGAIAELGLDAVNLSKLNPEVALQKILAELEKIPNQADRVRIAFKIFDTEGVGLVNLTADSLNEARENIDAVGASLSRIDVAKVEAANDAFADISLITKGLRNQITISLAEPLAFVAQQLFESAKQSGGLQVSIDNLVQSSLSGLSALARGAGGILTFIDGRPEIAAGGLVGYLIGGKLGFAVGAVAASTLDLVSGTVTEIRTKFDDSATEVDRALATLDRVRAQIELLESPVGVAIPFRNDLVETLSAQRAELQFFLADYVELDRIATTALSQPIGLAGQLGSAMNAVADATQLAAEQFGNFELPDIERPIVDQPELITVPIKPEFDFSEVEFPDQNFLQVQATIEANRQVETEMSQFYRRRQAANEEFQRTWTDFQNAGAKDRFQILSQEFGGTLEQLGTFSKTWFNINKALGISNAIVNTADGVTKALSAFPPPFNFVAAASVAAAGAAQIAVISRRKFGSNASAPSAPSNTAGSVSASTPSNERAPQVSQPEPQQQIMVSVFPPIGMSQSQIDEQIKESVRRSVDEGYIIPEYEVRFASR